MKKVASFFDNRGNLHVDCTECTRGYNGNDKDKCCCGFKQKRPHIKGCFCGTIMPEIDLSKAKRLS